MVDSWNTKAYEDYQVKTVLATLACNNGNGLDEL